MKYKKAEKPKPMNGWKYTLEEVKEYFKKCNCVLLDNVYINNRTKLKYKCSCGNVSYTQLDSFIRGSRCEQCRYKRSHDKLKLTIDFIKKKFEEAGCVLLSTEYKNSKTKLDYICSNGHHTKIAWNMFKRGRRCVKCRNEKTGDRRRLNFDYVRSEFAKMDCKLLSTEYNGSQTLLDYICECGEISKITWGNFQQGVRCIKCGHEKTTEKRRLAFEYIKKEFEKEGCTLITDNYINVITPLEYICSCGNKTSSTFVNFKNREGCSFCSSKRSRGELKISKFLENSDVEYISEYKINGCRDKRPVPFDFAITANNLILGLIEYDGKQHFEPIDFFGGEDSLQFVQEHDQIKNKYCEDNNIPLLRIPYTEFNNVENIVFDFLTTISA